MKIHWYTLNLSITPAPSPSPTPLLLPFPSMRHRKVLNARDPKIVNGPEVLDKYVGGSEEKIRALFSDAEKEQVL